MGLKIGEVFRDYCCLTVTATGARATLLADVTCQVYDETGAAFGAAIVATETSNGWYYAQFTPDTAGVWTTDWSKTANPGNYTFHYPYKLFHVGAGQEADICTRLGAPAGASVSADILAVDNFVDELEGRLTAARAGYIDELAAANLPTDVSAVKTVVDAIKAKTDNLPADPADDSDLDTSIGVIDAFHDVPAQNAVTNLQMRDIIGNKTDEPAFFVAGTHSLMRYAKAGALTGGGVSYSGVCDVGMGASTTTIVCDDLKGFGDDYFNTDWVMEIGLNDNSHGNAPEGNAPRDIQDYVSATGTFTTAAFSANVEANDRIIVTKRHLQLVDKTALAATPTVDSFAYKISKYLADGDGDFATGTALPSNVSLYDIIAGANGIPVFPAAAAPANDVSLAEVLRAIYDDTDALDTRLTAARAGYLDKLANRLQTRTWPSPYQKEVVLTNGAGDKSLPTVTLPNISGTIVHVYAGFKWRMQENTNAGANKLNGAQNIQVRVDTPGAWADAINFGDDLFGTAANTREGGDCAIGTIDLVGTVTAFNDGYEFQWDEAVADQSNLVFNDVQTFLIVSYY